MANIKSFPNNQDEYIGAEHVMKWLHGRTSGVFAADNNAAVTALPTPGMAVQVSDGTGWIANAGKDGIVWWVDNEKTSSAKLRLSIAAADGALNRIDRVIVEWKTTTYADLPEVKVLTGSIASTPTAPALTNNSTTRQISLAQVYVAAGTTAITASMITDERLNSAVCGLVTDSASIDTSTIEAQFRAVLEAIQRELADLESNAYASRVLSYKITLSASGWDGDLQSATVTGVSADETKTDVMASPDPADSENRAAYMDNDVYIIEQMDGAVVFACGSVPERDILVNVAVTIKGEMPTGTSYPNGDNVAYG